QTGKLTQLVANVLDTAEIDAKTMRLRPIDTNLADLVRVILHQEFNSAPCSIEFSGPEQCISRVDPRLIERVIINLVENAVKFSASGGTVKVQLDRTPDRRTILSVSDDGRGIPADRQEAIFDRFYQAHADSHVSGI